MTNSRSISNRMNIAHPKISMIIRENSEGRGWDLNPGARLHRPMGYQATSPRPPFIDLVCFSSSHSFGFPQKYEVILYVNMFKCARWSCGYQWIRCSLRTLSCRSCISSERSVRFLLYEELSVHYSQAQIALFPLEVFWI